MERIRVNTKNEGIKEFLTTILIILLLIVAYYLIFFGNGLIILGNILFTPFNWYQSLIWDYSTNNPCYSFCVGNNLTFEAYGKQDHTCVCADKPDVCVQSFCGESSFKKSHYYYPNTQSKSYSEMIGVGQ